MPTHPERVSALSARGAFDFTTVRVFAFSGLLVVLDQITKALVRGSISAGEERTIISSLLALTHVQNRGAAFGLFPSSTYFLIIVSVAVCLAIIFGRSWWTTRSVGFQVAVAFELGGAIGNLIDRLLYGSVTDFVLFLPELPMIGRWPAFNVADAALTCGAILLAIVLVLDNPRQNRLLPEPTKRETEAAS